MSLLAYEHMRSDPEHAVRGVAQFMGLDPSEECIATACEQSSIETMRANREKYDDAMMRALSERACDLPPDGEASKVGAGGVGRHQIGLSDELLRDLDSTWHDTIGAELGIADYGALLEVLAAT